MSAENPRMSGPEEVLPPGVIRLGPHTYQNSKGEIFEEDDHGNIFKKRAVNQPAAAPNDNISVAKAVPTLGDFDIEITLKGKGPVPFGFGNTPGSEGQDLAQQVARLVSAQMSNQSAFQESNVQYVPPLQQSQEPIQNNYNNTREPAASTQDANAQQRNLQAFNEQAQTALRNAEEELKAKRVKRLKVVTGIAIVTTVALAGGPVVQAATSRERAKEVCASQDILNIDNYGCYASEFLSEVFNANNIGKFVPEQN